jgi:hypothetical protein
VEEQHQHPHEEDDVDAHGRKKKMEPEQKLRSSSRTAAAVANVKMSSLVDMRVGFGVAEGRKTEGKTRKGHPSAEEEPVGSPKAKKAKTSDDADSR